MLELFVSAGLVNTRVDGIGNVIAERPGTSGDGHLVVSAHLDTVFPPGTDVSVTRSGDLLKGPGITDDARGLTALLTLARALDAAGITPRTSILFVATVGEEGLGDLRGVKHLFGPAGDARGAAGFISLDGAGLDRIVSRALGSRRYRIVVRGAGGHSWTDWGAPNPLHELSGISAELTRLPLPSRPLTTLTLARTGGGKSINAIPQQAWVEVDTRSADAAHLDTLEAKLRRTVERREKAVPALDFEVEIIGDRPGGATPDGSPLVRAAVEATRRRGKEPLLSLSSTDANVPMSLGIPAVTLGCGGDAGSAHTTEEWFRNTDGSDGIVRALDTVILAAGLP